MSSLGRFGSPNVSEIELQRTLCDQWPSVLKWLHGLDLLRSANIFCQFAAIGIGRDAEAKSGPMWKLKLVKP